MHSSLPFIAVDHLLELLDPNVSALIAAFFVASARAFYRGALNSLSPAATTLMSLLVTVLFAWGFYFLTERVESWPPRGILWFAAVGITSTLIARYVSFISINLVGLARGSILVQTSLIWSGAMAVFLLGEEITWGVGFGTLFIMFGSILLVAEGGEVRKTIPYHYYLAPISVALFLALAHYFLKLGFFWLPSASAGIVISSSTALMVLLAILPFTKEGIPRTWEFRPTLIVVLGGLANALAAVFFLAAIKNGKLVEVIPMNRLSVLIIIFFSWFFFRKQEAISWRVVAGGVLSVMGAWIIFAL